MKRSAAILGPTPSFVRWAIRIECPLRDTDEQNLPDRVFRELRGLRELSHGLRQDRVLDGICIHPRWNRDVDSAKGFFTEEVCEVFGGANQVDSSCTDCPANVCQRVSTESNESGRQQPVWAGCYGWFPSRHGTIDYPLLFQDVWQTCGSHPPIDGLLETDPYWYGLWQVGHWSGSSLRHLNRLFDQVRQQVTKSVEEDRNLVELATAARECLQSDLTLVAELVPQGHSDGLHWSIEPHCPDCSKEMSPQQLHCAACGRQGRPHPKTRKKVLGERPYRLLKEMVGPEKASEIILTYGNSINRQARP